MRAPTVLSIDAMGGDRGPAAVLGGLARALRVNPALRFIVHGPEAEIAPLIARRNRLARACELRPASGVIAMDLPPATALRRRRDSSMWAALQPVAAGEAAAVVSSGNTGALLAMAIAALKKGPGVGRPAIAVHWPARRREMYNVVLDVGAGIVAEPRALAQFAVLGAEYARVSFGHTRPRVGLLNNGTERGKGPEALAEAAELIAAAAADPAAEFAFAGFVEGTHIPTDMVDVIVTDGYTGNVALKTAEGTASFIREALITAFRFSWMSRIGSLFALTSMQRLRKRIDPRRVNGGVFLGLNGTVVKSHGGADAVGWAAAVDLAAAMAARDFPARVAQQLVKLDVGGKSGARTGNAQEDEAR